MEESMEAATIGSAVHHALEKIYAERAGQIVTAAFVEEQLKNKERIQNLVREYLAKRFDKESLTTGKNLLLFKVCVKLVEEFLKHEVKNIERLNDAGESLSIELLEGKLEHTICIDAKKIKISGKVDRIEKVAGVFQITDYKTSKYSTIPVLDEETWEALTTDPKYAKPVQLMVYAWLHNRMHGTDAPVRSGIYWLRESDKSLDTLRVDKTNDVLSGIPSGATRATSPGLAGADSTRGRPAWRSAHPIRPPHTHRGRNVRRGTRVRSLRAARVKSKPSPSDRGAARRPAC